VGVELGMTVNIRVEVRVASGLEVGDGCIIRLGVDELVRLCKAFVVPIGLIDKLFNVLVLEAKTFLDGFVVLQAEVVNNITNHRVATALWSLVRLHTQRLIGDIEVTCLYRDDLNHNN
jgi:hypothetical protein